MDPLLDYISTLENRFISIRQYLHQHPELSWKEVETTNYICKILEELGLKYQRLDNTGVFVDFIQDPNSKIIIYRADIDALPINEEIQADYKSRNEGVAHSCGHDFHTTVALGLAFVLNHFRKDLKRNIRILFQPAEEVIPSGAQSLLSTNILDNVDHFLAIHSEPNLNAGKISIVDDWVTTQYVSYQITLTSETGHVAHPYRSPDVIFTASQIITQLYAHINRKNRYDEFFLMTFSIIKAGQKINVIPSQLELSGSLRISKKDKTEEIKSFIDRVIVSICNLNNVKVEIEHVHGPPPVENDPDLAKRIRKIAVESYRPENVLTNIRTMGSEDFSYFLEKAKGCYMRVGISNENVNASLHSSKFDIDETVISKTIYFISKLCLSEY